MGSYSDMTGFHVKVKTEQAELVKKLINFSNQPDVKYKPDQDIRDMFQACLKTNDVNLPEVALKQDSPAFLFYGADIEESNSPEFKILSVSNHDCVKNYACLLLACIIAHFAQEEAWITFDDGCERWGYVAGPDGVHVLNYTVTKGDKIA